MKHGTGYGYVSGCRCPACTRAQRDRMAAFRSRFKTVPPWAYHGYVSTYSNYGCRCEECKKAKADACRRYRQTGSTK